ncbi:MAG: DUF4416 family protein [Bacteriovoracaceae bacterium]|nr:DUF4416 family protein [Bacteriovoracaceae bacterium]
MAQLKVADKGLIFASCIFNPEQFSLERLLSVWAQRYSLSGTFNPEFNPSLQYYSKEMGSDLQRVILWSDELYIREELIEGKLWADGVESQSLLEGNRVVNIDMGLLLKEQMLLATSKPYAHRIYLRDGVYVDLTYKYENKSYNFLPWTYPDYQSGEKVELFNSLRPILFK